MKYWSNLNLQRYLMASDSIISNMRRSNAIKFETNSNKTRYIYKKDEILAQFPGGPFVNSATLIKAIGCSRNNYRTFIVNKWSTINVL